MRRTLVLLHRWCGLFIAVFLFVAGLTGALISWDHELDAWLNPRLWYSEAPSGSQPRPALELATELERREPRLQVRFMPLRPEAGHALLMSVRPRVDPATGKLHELGYNQLALDPHTGDVQAQRTWGAISLSRENILPFLYKLHYTMHIPEGFGIDVGLVFMGIVAIVWTLDCFVALAISFPSRRHWRRSLAFRFRAGGHRLLFDLHRSGGVWAWAVLLILSVTAVSMNLGDEVVRPLVAAVSPLTPDPFDALEPAPEDRPIEPQITRETALAAAQAEAVRRGLEAPAGGLFYAPDHGIYAVGFYHPENDHGDGSLGNPWIYVSGRDGSLMGAEIPGEGSAGDIFMQAQFPLHSGRLFGLPGRIFVSALGLIVAMLSATGVVIWARKRRSRTRPAPAALEGQLSRQEA